MLDVGWSELLVISAVALVAIGPKDMPKVMHALGRLAGKARGFMNEIQGNFEQLSREAEEVGKSKEDPVSKTTSSNEEDEGDEPPIKPHNTKNDNS